MHTLGGIQPCFNSQNNPHFRLPANVPSKLLDRFRKMPSMRDVSQRRPRGSAGARCRGESNIGRNNFAGLLVGRPRCNKSCRRLSFARELSSGTLGCHDWTSHLRDTPTRGHRTPRFVIKAIQGALHILLRHYTFPLRRAASARVCVSARLDGMS